MVFDSKYITWIGSEIILKNRNKFDFFFVLSFQISSATIFASALQQKSNNNKYLNVALLFMIVTIIMIITITMMCMITWNFFLLYMKCSEYLKILKKCKE